MPDSSCCVEAAQYHTNQFCLILSSPFPVSTCCFLFLLVFFPSLFCILDEDWKCSGAGTIRLFRVSVYCCSLLAWHNSSLNSNAK